MTTRQAREAAFLADVNRATSAFALSNAGVAQGLASSIVAARNRRGRPFDSLIEASRALGLPEFDNWLLDTVLPPADTGCPVLLFPLRLETRLVEGKLRVRFYPDDVLVDHHDPALTPVEVAAGGEFVAQLRGASSIAPQAAWGRLCARLGRRRAAWVARRLLADAETRAELPDDTQRRASCFAFLPDRFVVYLVNPNGTLAHPPIPGAMVRADLALVRAASGSGDLFCGDAAWMAEFDEALREGMAVEVPLGALDAPEGRLARIVVVGIRRATADEGAEQLTAVLEAHRYGAGLAFVEAGTRTHNNGATRSGWTSGDDAGASYATEFRGDDTPPDAVWRALTTALGIAPDSSTLRQVDGADVPLPQGGVALRAALWLATGGAWLRHLVPGALDQRQIATLGAHFAEFVQPAGPLPAIRVGRVPYGVLPVTRIDPAAFPQGTNLWGAIEAPLVGVLDRLQRTWRSALRCHARVPRMTGSDAPDASLVSILAMDPVSSVVAARPFVDLQFCAWALLAMAEQVFPGDVAAQVAGFQRWLYEARRLAGEDLSTLLSLAGVDAGVTTGQPATALRASPLLEMLGWYEAHRAPYRVTVTGDGSDTRAWIDQLRGGVLQQDPKTVLHLLLQAAWREACAIEAERLDRGLVVRLAALFGELRDLSHTTLEARLMETLDSLSHRLDAWYTSLATRRLAEGRATSPTGVHLGVFGWVDDLTLIPQERPSAGYIHAPSAAQAATAAVLCNAWLGHGSTGENPFRVNLSSRPVRLARELIEGVREGQQPGALLGYRFERALRDAGLPHLVEVFRALFPLVAGALQPSEDDEPAEAVAARNVVDGMALVRAWRQAPDAQDETVAGAHRLRTLVRSLGGADSALSPLLDELGDALDAVGDLLLFEGAHHAVQGNVERAAAALDASAGHGLYPNATSLDTPRTGKTLEHRVCLLVPPAPSRVPSDAGPRDRAEPRLAAWFAALLGDRRTLGCAVAFTWTDAAGQPQPPLCVNTASAAELGRLLRLDRDAARRLVEHRRLHGPFASIAALLDLAAVPVDQRSHLVGHVTVGLPVTLDDLGITAFDFLFLAAGWPGGGASELDERICRIARARDGLPLTWPVRVLADEAGPGQRCLADAALLADATLDLLSRATPMQPRDLCGLERSAPPSLSKNELRELHGRARGALTSLQTLASQLADALSAYQATIAAPQDPVTGGPVDLDEGDQREERAALRRAIDAALQGISRFGVADAFAPGPWEVGLVARARRAHAEATRRTAAAAAALERRPSAEGALDSLRDALAALFGSSFRVLPQFLPALAADLSRSAGALAPYAPPAGVHTWLQGAAAVHPPLDSLVDWITLAEAWCPDTPATRVEVVQIPAADRDRWLALEDSARGRGRPRQALAFAFVGGGVANGAALRSAAGLLVHTFRDVVPDETVRTSVGFQYDLPAAQAQQALLLAVSTGLEATWSEDAVFATVADTAALARLRAVDAHALGTPAGSDPLEPALGRLLPATFVAGDPADPTSGTAASAPRRRATGDLPDIHALMRLFHLEPDA